MFPQYFHYFDRTQCRKWTQYNVNLQYNEIKLERKVGKDEHPNKFTNSHRQSKFSTFFRILERKIKVVFFTYPSFELRERCKRLTETTCSFLLFDSPLSCKIISIQPSVSLLSGVGSLVSIEPVTTVFKQYKIQIRSHLPSPPSPRSNQSSETSQHAVR